MSSISSNNIPGIHPEDAGGKSVKKKDEKEVTVILIPDNNPKAKELSSVNAQNAVSNQVHVQDIPVNKVSESVEIEELSEVIDLADLEGDLQSSPSESAHEASPSNVPTNDPLLSLLKEQYTLAKSAKENINQILDAPQAGFDFLNNAAVVVPVVSANVSNVMRAQRMTNMKADLGEISLMYNIPKELSNVALLIYQNKQLGKIENQIKDMENESKSLGKQLGNAKLTPEQRTKASDKKAALDAEIRGAKVFIKDEKKGISAEAKKIIISNGVALPGNLLTMMRILSISIPVVKLGLIWASGVFGAAGAGILLLKAKKDVGDQKAGMNDYRQDAFRQGNSAKRGDELKPVENKEVKWIKTAIGQEVPLQEGEKAEEANVLYDGTNPADKKETTIKMDPVGRISMATNLEVRKQNLLAMKDEIISKNAYMDGFGGFVDQVKSQTNVNVAYSMLSEEAGGFISVPQGATMESLRRDLSNLPQLKLLKEGYENKYTEQTYFAVFERVMKEINEDLDKIIAGEKDATGMREKFEKAGLNVPSEVEQLMRGVTKNTIPGTLALNIKGELAKPEVRENLLTRFIDVNSSQQMTDSARNAIKAQTLKKQGRKLVDVLRNYSKAKIIFGGALVASTAIIAMTGLVAFSTVAIPIAILLAPAIGMTALSAGFVLLGIKRFRKERPDEFKKTTVMDQVKLSTYSIPQGFHELRAQKNKISGAKNKLEQDVTKLKLEGKKADLNLIAAIKDNQTTPNAHKNKLYEQKIVATKKEIAKLETEIRKLDIKMVASEKKAERLQKSVNKYAAKVNPIQDKRNAGKLSDELEVKRPFRKEVEKMLGGCKPEEKARLVGLFRGYESMPAGEAINVMTDALMRDTSLIDGDIKKTAAYMGIDLTDKKEESEVKALVTKFFLGG